MLDTATPQARTEAGQAPAGRAQSQNELLQELDKSIDLDADVETSREASDVPAGHARVEVPDVTDPAANRLVDLARALVAVRRAGTETGVLLVDFEGASQRVAPEGVAELRARLTAEVASAANKVRRIVGNAKGLYGAQKELENGSLIDAAVAGVSRLVGGAQQIEPLISQFVTEAETTLAAIETFAARGQVAGAATALRDAEVAARKAFALVESYVGRVEAGAGATATGLEFTRNAAMITLGVLATVATGGAAAAATGVAGSSAAGMGAGAGTASLIAGVAPVAATVGQAAVAKGLGDDVDWKGIAVESAKQIVLARFGGKIAGGVLGRLLPGRVAGEIEDVLLKKVLAHIGAHEVATFFTTCVEQTIEVLRGKDVTWESFADELIARLTDPAGILMAALRGVVDTYFDYKSRSQPARDTQQKGGQQRRKLSTQQRRQLPGQTGTHALEAGGGEEQTGQEQTGPEQTGQEQTGQEQTGQEQTGQEQTGQEQTGQEQTGQEQTGQEQPARTSDPDGRMSTEGAGKNADSASRSGPRGIGTGTRKSARILLSAEEIERLKQEYKEIGGDPETLRFNEGRQTGYLDGEVYVRGDVLPVEDAVHPRSRMSSRAVLAHELYGHAQYPDTKLPVGAWNDEFRASYMAARNAPNLNEFERADLVRDAMTRAEEAGVRIRLNKIMKGILYGY